MKITFPTIDLEISLSEIEYHYLKFICQETLQTSDEVLRSQLRQLQLPGVPDFNTWRLEQAQTSQLALPAATATVDVQPTPAEVAEVEDVEPLAVEEPDAPPEPPASTAKKKRDRRPPAPKQFDAKTLLPDFRSKSVQEAVQIVLAEAPNRLFGTDDVLPQIYGEFTGEDLIKARRSLGKVLSLGATRGLWQRPSEKPRYQALADEPQPDAEIEDERGASMK